MLSAFGRFWADSTSGGGGGVLSAFGPIQPLGGGGGVPVRFRPIQPVGGGGGGGGGCCRYRPNSINQVSALSADSTSGRWAVEAHLWGMRMYVNKMGGGTIRGGGRHSVTCLPPLLPGDAHENARYLYMHCSYVHCYMYVILSKHCHFQFVMQVIFA